MKSEILAVILMLLVVGSLGVGYFAGGQLNVRTTTSTSTILTTATITTTITSGTTYGTFTYAPKGPLQVDSVWATGTPGRNGIQNVTFYVTLENIGASPIYATGGYGISSLSSSVSGNSTVLREAPAIQCPGAIFLLTLDQGQNYTAYAPGCNTGFNYQLVHSGSVSMVFSFGWSTNKQGFPTSYSNSTTISANFTFA